ncbi:beta strand repeat-containing protein [Roseibacillus ishigakijimensis]|uniref:Autotransporter-associated beta strand repeat-containing protein n=1 Tax=Roseibacillus ishigakijimensis TaxID=454146 RepID=A0A934RUV1_9BACT|nr:autotransporter-associated beta strand repeat-containing protein [Roseibacillus ishigakijimensis]MBK1835419.1 autotransporter-associated beta strand repeat-containing protein [Roseibacillus ishigakijimensis]
MKKTIKLSLLLVGTYTGLASFSFGQSTWDFGASTQNFTDDANWDPDGVPANGNWTVNIAADGQTPIISTAVVATAADTWVGSGDGTSGVLTIESGGSIDTSTKWLRVGHLGGTGVLNVLAGANYISDNQIRLGEDGGNGTLNVDGGTISVAALDGNGMATINVTNNGSLTTTGGNVRIGSGGGTLTEGTINASGQFFIGSGGMGEFTMSGGSLTTGSWFVPGIGTTDGVPHDGTFNLTGGTLTTSTTQGFTTIGAGGANGTMTMSGGTWTETNTIMLGENTGGSGTLNLTDGLLTTPRIDVAVAGNGTLNLDGGELHTHSIVSGAGTSTINVNGTLITVTADSEEFFSGGTVNLLSDMEVDTAGFNVSGTSNLEGSGGIVKNGLGSLTFSADNPIYSGNMTVNAGDLIVGARFNVPASGDITVADDAGFGVRVLVPGDYVQPTNLSLTGATSRLHLNYLDAEFSVPGAPIIVDGGTFAIDGTITVNLDGVDLATGTYTLIDYSGATKTGTATWQIGTLPETITADGVIVDTGSEIQLSLIAPAPLWEGTEASGDWNLSDLHWVDQATNDQIAFENGLSATFDDSALNYEVVVTEDLTPGAIFFENDFENYTLSSGGGVITGTTGLSKVNGIPANNEGTLTIDGGMANSYTGVTTLGGGIVAIDTFTAAGVPGPLGAATADPANLVFAGGTLNYSGPAVANFDRGFTVTGDGSALVTANDLTLTGTYAGGTEGGSLTKSGAGNITVTSLTENTFGGTGYPSLAIAEADWTFLGNGKEGDQSNNIPGELWVGSIEGVEANLLVEDSILNVGGFFAISRGIGSGVETTITVTDSTVTSGSFSTGFNNGLAANDNLTNITLSGSDWTNGDLAFLSESPNADTVMTLSNGSTLSTNRLLVGMGTDTTAEVTLNDTSSVTLGSSWLAIGTGYGAATNAVGVVTLNDNAVFTDNAGDFNIGDGNGGQGTLTINDSASATATGVVFIGKGEGTGTVTSTGSLVMNGGSFTAQNNIVLGLQNGATGTVEVNGGVFSSTIDGGVVLIGENGAGTFTVNGTGSASFNSVVTLGTNATSVGVLNIETGGLFTANSLNGGAGSATVNFAGGTLQANEDNATFLTGNLTSVLQAAGGTIDTQAHTLTTVAPLSGSGTLEKIGSGTLILGAASGHAGDTTVSEGVLETTNPIFGDAGTLTIASGASVSLPHGQVDRLVALTINGTALPDGDYDSSTHPGAITGTGTLRVGPVIANPYETWIATYYPGESDPALVGATADPDGDGQSNLVEFAFGGLPDDSSSLALATEIIADSNGNSQDELLYTMAVRSGTPAFAGTPSPSASHDGITYTVQGSLDLQDFSSAVSVVTPPVTAGLPAAPSGYEYRTFSLTASDGLSGKGFLRASVSE